MAVCEDDDVFRYIATKGRNDFDPKRTNMEIIIYHHCVLVVLLQHKFLNGNFNINHMCQ